MAVMQQSRRPASPAVARWEPPREFEDLQMRLRRAEVTCRLKTAAAAPGPTMTKEAALDQIERWSVEKKRTDKNYLQLESKLLPVVDQIIKDLPPQYWLPAIQAVYRALAGIYL